MQPSTSQLLQVTPLGSNLGQLASPSSRLQQTTTPTIQQPYNPGYIPLQANHSFSRFVQPQNLFSQQQAYQPGVMLWNLSHLVGPAPAPPNFRGALPPNMVNVSWSNHPVPYAQSLYPPANAKYIPASPHEQQVELNGPAPAPPHQNILSAALHSLARLL